MSESTRTPNDTRCPYCDSQVTLVNGLFPPHENAAGNRCLGPDAEPGDRAPALRRHEAALLDEPLADQVRDDVGDGRG